MGWPVSISDSIVSSPAIGDVDGDGKVEIVVATDTSYGYTGLLYAFKTTGEKLGGLWPAYTDGNIYSSPALGDLDNDGDLEIVLGSSRYYGSLGLTGGRINAWDLTSRFDPAEGTCCFLISITHIVTVPLLCFVDQWVRFD